MGKLNKIGCFLITLIISSCSSSYRFNKQIKKLDRENNVEYININKKILNSINLNNTDHILYKIKPKYSYNSFEGWDVVIFDENNNNIYNIDYDNKLKISILNDKIYDYDKKYNEFVYSLFKKKSCDTLKILSEKNTDVFNQERFYEINLKTNLNRMCEYYEIMDFLRLYEENQTKH